MIIWRLCGRYNDNSERLCSLICGSFLNNEIRYIGTCTFVYSSSHLCGWLTVAVSHTSSFYTLRLGTFLFYFIIGALFMNRHSLLLNSSTIIQWKSLMCQCQMQTYTISHKKLNDVHNFIFYICFVCHRQCHACHSIPSYPIPFILLFMPTFLLDIFALSF